ncbi:MAG: hypothetical protein DMF68_20100 [Acidobacteria bacterium]|nr:MAG: hypothetical protein DMF68_20100 [Acidobacteriota bacterium]
MEVFPITIPCFSTAILGFGILILRLGIAILGLGIALPSFVIALLCLELAISTAKTQFWQRKDAIYLSKIALSGIFDRKDPSESVIYSS